MQTAFTPSEIARLQLEQSGLYVVASAHALHFFEICITFSQEVEVIWRHRKKWSAMTWIYILTRYTSVLWNVFDLIPVWGMMVCKASQYIIYILILMQFFYFGCFSTLRVYALLDGKLLVPGIVFFFNLIPFAMNLFELISDTIVIDAEECTMSSPWAYSLSLRCTYAPRTCFAFFIGDVLVLLVTWSKTASLYREARHLGIRAPIATLLFRDGTLYFLLLLTINVLQVIGINIRDSLALGVSGGLVANVTPIIVCRFILNLRQASPSGSSRLSDNQSVSLRFVGNAGESLRFGRDEDEEMEVPVGTAEHLTDLCRSDHISTGGEDGRC